MARKESKMASTEDAKTGRQEIPPVLPAEMQLKWGLALLGKEKALEYLKWLTERIERSSQ
jgi:hypothetical protein